MTQEQKTITSILYKCAKESTIDIGANFFAYTFLSPVSLPIALKIYATSAALYTLSCTVGDLGGQYYGTEAKIIGRAAGNAIKYLGVAYVSPPAPIQTFTINQFGEVEIDLLSGIVLDIFTAFRGAVNGGLYGAASVYLSSEAEIYSPMGIEMIDSAISNYSPESLGEGFLVGGAIYACSYIYDNGFSKLIDDTVDAFVADFNASLANISNANANRVKFPLSEGGYYVLKDIGTRTIKVYYPACSKTDKITQDVLPLIGTPVDIYDKHIVNIANSSQLVDMALLGLDNTFSDIQMFEESQYMLF